MSNWLEALRDRVVVRSQVGKRKLDSALVRRELDRKKYDVGAAFIALVREGRAAIPQEIAALVKEARELEDRLDAHRADIAGLTSQG